MSFVILGRLVAESSFELTDAARWKKARFCVESGQNWRGPKTPSRIESHIKRYDQSISNSHLLLELLDLTVFQFRDGKVALGSCIKLVQPHNYFASRDRASDLVTSQLRIDISTFYRPIQNSSLSYSRFQISIILQ